MSDSVPQPTLAVASPTPKAVESTTQSNPAVTAPAPRPLGLALGALGIVFGDIGTSPLYALKECFHGEFSVFPTPANVLGVLSLVFWSLTAVVTVKYLTFIMKADNRGEGGIFALLALVPPARDPSRVRIRGAVTLLALFGAALLYGDGVITPAISVLSAVEGLDVATTAMHQVIVPITVVILMALFWVQSRGTHHIGRMFGPVMLLWFAAMALFGVWHIADNWRILEAVNPWYGVRFFLQHKLHGFVVLGSVVLAITGGEALYADMGHFGRSPIRMAWYGIVFPALLLNYFGQGALILRNPSVSENPFFATVGPTLLIPMVILATVATVIASQALISGAFSLTRQAVQLGYCPRVTILHTSTEHEGQIYIPEVNTALAVACIALVLGFKESSRLAAAYGIAVTGTMAITTVVYYVVVRDRWGWSRAKAMPLAAMFLMFDLAFFGANLLKFVDGGWFPIFVALGVYSLMTTWKTGRAELAARFISSAVPLDLLLQDVARNKPHRVNGTAVFLTPSTSGAPPVLLHHLKHNQVLHQQVVLLSITSVDAPTVPTTERVTVEPLGEGFFRVIARYGFMQTPKIPDVMRLARKYHHLETEGATTSFYLGRETLLTRGRSKMARWRKRLFAFVSKNARPATEYFSIPPGRVIELGMQVEL